MRFSKGYNVVFLIEYLIFAIVDGQHTEKAGVCFKQFAMIWERPLEKSFCHDLQHRIMIHPYDTVQPTGMGMVEIPAELAEAV